MANIIAVCERDFLRMTLLASLFGAFLGGRNYWHSGEASIAFKIQVSEEVRLFKGLRIRVYRCLVFPEGLWKIWRWRFSNWLVTGQEGSFLNFGHQEDKTYIQFSIIVWVYWDGWPEMRFLFFIHSTPLLGWDSDFEDHKWILYPINIPVCVLPVYGSMSI